MDRAPASEAGGAGSIPVGGAGSIPVGSAIQVVLEIEANRVWLMLCYEWGTSSAGRASRSQRGGRGFESLVLH